MTTTKKSNSTITVSFYEEDNKTIDAAYFQFEDGWVTFKDSEHKAIAAYPKNNVTGIEFGK